MKRISTIFLSFDEDQHHSQTSNVPHIYVLQVSKSPQKDRTVDRMHHRFETGAFQSGCFAFC